MSHYLESIEKFKLLPGYIKNGLGGDETMLNIKTIELAFDVELKFLVVLLAIGEIAFEDIPNYLKEDQGVDESIGLEIKNELLKSVFNFLFDEEYDQVRVKEILNNGLVNAINGNFNLSKLNDELLILLINEEIKGEEFFKILNSNEEELTKKEFKLGGVQNSPSVGNWLKDFISQKGSAIFDDVILTDYITHSPNCQKLNEEDRRLVRKLLILYRNLKFFPESMPNDTGEGWEIIPIDDEVKEFNREALSSPKTREEKNIDVLLVESKGYGEDSLEKKAIEEEIGQEKRIEGLRIMANRYPEGSLEWRAIMDEIRKLN